MNLLNIGCGSVFHSSWTNIDIEPSSPKVKACDITKGLPYSDAEFDACYSSHLLEHLNKAEAEKLIKECFRILKPQGVIRVVVPDLENIVINYLKILEKIDSGVKEAEADYDWIMLEMYDQFVRTFSGGEMLHYLINPNLPNKDFVLLRIGLEAEKIFENVEAKKNKNTKFLLQKIKSKRFSWYLFKFQTFILTNIARVIAGNKAALGVKEGLFRQTGEIHRWMYDRFSLRRLLEKTGFINVRVCRADESSIPNFNSYDLDMIEGRIRKPDSLFMEGIKP